MLSGMNYSLSSSWTYMKASPDAGTIQKPSSKLSNPSPLKPVYQDVTSVDNIIDEVTLEKYLKEHEKHEKNIKVVNKSQQSTNLLSSFWSHPVTKTAKDMSSFLKKCQYQLATLSPGNKNKFNKQINTYQIQGALLLFTPRQLIYCM